MIECEQMNLNLNCYGKETQHVSNQHVLSISDSYFELQNGRHIKIYTLLYIH